MATKKAAQSSAFHSRYSLRVDGGGWADQAAQEIATMQGDEQSRWYALFDHLDSARPQPPAIDWQSVRDDVASRCLYEQTVPDPDHPAIPPGTEEYCMALTQAGPDEAWFETLRAHSSRLGNETIAAHFATWIRAATRSGVGNLNRAGANRHILHVMLWSTTQFRTPACIDAMRQLGAFATAHNTAQGTTIAIILAAIASEESLAALHILAENSKRPTPRKRFLRAASHVERRLGLTAEDAAEGFVPTYDLDSQGTRRLDLGAAHAQIALRGLRVEIKWSDSEGKALKDAPAAVKRLHAAEMKDFKSDAKAIGTMLLAQRDRLDRLMSFSRNWTYDRFKKCYLDHPLVGHLARKLIWQVDEMPILFRDGEARDISGSAKVLTAAARIGLWHPIGRPADEVLAWRKRLESLEITQPLKQAHREVYVVTDAEQNTRTYSNRFSAHLLRQHQFAELARSRVWDYCLQGAWDSDWHDAAMRRNIVGGFRAEFWVSRTDIQDHTPPGILLYVSSDQVRFYRGDERESLPLDQVPPLVFSEIMRDVDLFVSVASVGNDPTWQDGGPEGRYRQYWHDYSFGQLSETAKTRRAVLETLLPRLGALRGRWSLEERFLVIRGDIRSYKIHLGSGNILMSPNDQYLCIVPDRSAGKAGDIFLPFEGDSTLSIILSKAFLLAEDRKIKDPTITRQIGG